MKKTGCFMGQMTAFLFAFLFAIENEFLSPLSRPCLFFSLSFPRFQRKRLLFLLFPSLRSFDIPSQQLRLTGTLRSFLTAYILGISTPPFPQLGVRPLCVPFSTTARVLFSNAQSYPFLEIANIGGCASLSVLAPRVVANANHHLRPHFWLRESLPSIRLFPSRSAYGLSRAFRGAPFSWVDGFPVLSA